MDIKTRFSELWQTTRKKIGTFFNKAGDSFKKILNRFRKTEKSPEESRSDNITAQADAEQNAAAPATPMQKAGRVFRIVGIWLYRLRRIFMAIPVIWYAVKLARYNLQNLPEQVGLYLQATGEYAKMIDRNLAVYGPLAVTAACLLLMFFSRRARYPWVISVFTLLLPILILFTNLYPQ